MTVNDAGGAPPISDIGIDPATDEVSFIWPAPAGITDPNALTDGVDRSIILGDDWEAAPDAIITITDGVVTFKDPDPPTGKAFYRVNRP